MNKTVTGVFIAAVASATIFTASASTGSELYRQECMKVDSPYRGWGDYILYSDCFMACETEDVCLHRQIKLPETYRDRGYYANGYIKIGRRKYKSPTYRNNNGIVDVVINRGKSYLDNADDYIQSVSDYVLDKDEYITFGTYSDAKGEVKTDDRTYYHTDDFCKDGTVIMVMNIAGDAHDKNGDYIVDMWNFD